MDSSSLPSIMKGVGGCVVGINHHYSQLLFGGEEGEVLGVLQKYKDMRWHSEAYTFRNYFCLN